MRCTSAKSKAIFTGPNYCLEKLHSQFLHVVSEMYAVKKKEKEEDLVDVVFSWKLDDVFNNKLYKNLVKEIPETFSSLKDYASCFMVPLLEETRTSLRSNLNQLSQAPLFQVLVIEHPTKKRPCFKLIVQQVSNIGQYSLDRSELEEPKSGDLFAFSSVRPKSVGDLVRSNRPYTIAVVTKSDDPKGMKYMVEVRINRSLANMDPKIEPIYAVLLENLTTNNRIWKCLNLVLKRNQNNSTCGVTNIALYNGSESEKCDCWSGTAEAVEQKLSRFYLNEAQAATVMSCLTGRKCHHQHKAKLIWGPPGTGKTKTVSSLLWTLLEQRCKTLTCAPTNVAVVQIASRLLFLLKDKIPAGCSFGDVVLFGNEKKMKIYELGLESIYLRHRACQLMPCFARLTGWNNQLQEMIALFEDCFSRYNSYLKELKEANERKRLMYIRGKEKRESKDGQKMKETWAAKKADKDNIVSAEKKQKHKNKVKWGKKGGKDVVEEETFKAEKPMTFTQFVKKRFVAISHCLKQHIRILRQHLSSNKLTPFVIKHLNSFLSMMNPLMIWFDSGFHVDLDLEKVYTIPVQIEKNSLGKNMAFKMNISQEQLRSSFQLGRRDGLSIQDICNGWRDTATKGVWKARLEFIHFVSNLLKILELPIFSDRWLIEKFCLENATLILCTACSSFRMRSVPWSAELLIVDEAAQLKECETLIPIQLPGLKHVVLIGDECQLPAMIMSEVCQRAFFGRSLFERLVSLGHEKHLLNVQYRMHPSISTFPNDKFYDKLIMDGENVKLKSYERVYLPGRMYGSYSFINVHSGIERFDAKHSRKNMVEVEVVSILLEKLFRVYMKLKLRLTIGIISPYTAQVVAIEKKLGKRYEKLNGFNVKVKSVDGFQGGEEDIIIMSTVRSNISGSVGFLSNLQRTNVALTRAKHCLWILGNENTLLNSGTIWKDVVLDANNRGYLFEAEWDYDLVKAVGSRNIGLDHFDDMFNKESPFFSNAKWKVLFGDDFRKSLQNVRQMNVRCEIVELVKKLADGFRPNDKNRSKVASAHSLNLLKHCSVRSQGLFWTVEVCKDSSDTNYTQALKFWDILPMSEAPTLTKKLEDMFQKYDEEYISRCKFRCIDGDSEVPMCWPIGENIALRSTTTSTDMFADQISLANHFASLKLVHESSCC